MGDDQYSNARTNYNRGYDDFNNYYSDRNTKNYKDEQRNYRDEPRSQYGYREYAPEYDENKKNYNRNEYYRKPSDYYLKNENNYSKVSDLDYSKKNFAYDDYQKKARLDSRGPFNVQQDQFYSKDQSYINKPYKIKHVPAEPNSTIGVFGFNPSTTEEDLKNCLSDKLKNLSEYTFKLIMDERTMLCKGYCFINFKCLDDAISAKHILNLENFRGQDFKCDYSYKQGILGE